MTIQKNPSEDEVDRKNTVDLGVRKASSVLRQDGRNVDRIV